METTLDDLAQRISRGDIKRIELYKTIISLLKKAPSPSDKKKYADLLGKVLVEESDYKVKEILEALLTSDNKIIKLKPRRVLEMLHAVSSEDLKLRIPLNLYIYRGKQYLINDEAEKAIELFKHVHENNHNTGVIEYIKVIFLKLCEEYSEEGRYDQAADLLKQYCEIDPNDITVNHKLAVLITLYTKLSRIESIDASWNRILKLWHIQYKQSGDNQIREKILAKHKYFVTKFVELEKWALAKRELSKILELEPDNMIAKRAFVQI